MSENPPETPSRRSSLYSSTSSSSKRRKRSRVREFLFGNRRHSAIPTTESSEDFAATSRPTDRGLSKTSLDSFNNTQTERRAETPTPSPSQAQRQRPVSELLPSVSSPSTVSRETPTLPSLNLGHPISQDPSDEQDQTTPTQENPTPSLPSTPARAPVPVAPTVTAPAANTINTVPTNRNMAAAASVNGSARAPATQIAIVHDALPKFEKRVKTLHFSLTKGEAGPTRITIEDFLDYVMGERLRRIPHQGGRWDRVLKWAEYYTTQVSLFEQCVHGFLANSMEASQLVYVCCRALLEMGPSQAHALERAFRVMYEQAVVLSFFIRHQDMLQVSEVRPELGHAYVALVQLALDIAIYYNKRSKSAKGTVVLNFQALFGRTIQSFFRRKDNVANAMWTHELRRSPETENITVEISTIRAWLGAHSSGLPVSISNPKSERAEFSCEWFQPHLADFIRSKDDILSLEGPSGSGKSVLASWIIERLQRPIGRRYIEPISYFLDANVPSQSTPLNLVKGLLVQLLEKHVGDVELYKSLVTVYELSTRSGTSHEIEEALWEILDHATKNANDMIIVVDGVNEANGSKDAPTRVFERLHALAAKYFGVRLIVGSQQIPQSYPKTKHFRITPEHTRTDVFNLARHFLTHKGHFHEGDADLDKTAEQIAAKASGSFVTANLILYLIDKEKTKESMVQAITKTQSIDNILTVLLQQAVKKPAIKLILSWLLISQNNLTVDDLRTLLEVDVAKGSRTSYAGDLREDLIEFTDPLLTVQDGVIRYRHLSISEHLRHIAQQGKDLLTPQEAHHDFLNRILLHVKLSLTRDEQPSTEDLEPAMVDELYHDVPLLSYTVRNWTVHFRHTKMWSESGTYNYDANFKRVFPSVAIFPLLEKSTWETALSLTEVTTLYKIALHIRETVLGRNEPSVLQSYLNIAIISQKTGDSVHARDYYFSAFSISKTVLGIHSSLTAYFATTYLNLVQTTTVTKRDTLATHKEETLLYLVEHAKHEHDESSDLTLKYKMQLGDLYKSIQETSRASSVYREVYETTKTMHGVSDERTTKISEALKVTLRDEQKPDEIVKYTQPVFVVAETTMAVDDSRRVTATLQMAQTYESQKDFSKAEELYVLLWQRLAENAHKVQTSESHVQVIEAVLSYVAFLRRHGRKSEAQATLIGLSSEYEHKEIKSDAVASKLTVVGRELRELGVATVAVSIFASLWSYFKKTNRQNSKEAADVAINLTHTAKDVPDHASSKSYTSVLLEVFQSSFSSSTTMQVDATTIHTCQTLSAYHVQSEHWAEAAEICAKLLASLWVSLSTFKSPEKFPDQHVHEAIEIALREAHCRHKMSQLDRAEKLYLYIFRAAKNSMKIDDQRVTQMVHTIVTFYKTTYQSDKLTAFYEELLISYRKSLGTANKTTITTLYALAALYVKTKPERAIEIYNEILKALNKDSKVCHHDALPAAEAISTLYYERREWAHAQSIFSILWVTITQKAKEYSLQEHFVQTIYSRYTHILTTEVKTEYSVLRQIASEYRQTSIATFGASSETALEANLALAEISSRDEKHQQEAISLYEETFEHTKKSNVTNKSLLKALSGASSKLSHLYISNATTNTSNTEKATTLYKEQYERSKTQYGYSHHTTLDSIRGLVLLWTKSKTTEHTTQATRELQTSTVSVINTEKDSKALYDSATTLGETYVKAGLVQKGLELLAELRRQIIFKDFSRSGTSGVKVSETVDRSSYIFLSTFEETLYERKTSFSVIMTELLTETVLYHQYRQQVDKKTRIDLILHSGARLRVFLLGRKRVDEVKRIEDEMFELFLKALGSEIKTDKEITRRFFIVMLEELSKDRHSAHLGNAACNGGNSKVLQYLQEGKFAEAYELGLCVFQFVHAHKGYHHAGNIGSGFKLSLYTAGRGAPKPTDEKIRGQMLELSRSILKETLDACKSLKLEFVAMQLTELNDLVALMGEQKNYTDLEWLLEQLWHSRHNQLTWSPATVVSIGRRLVECRFAYGKRDSAIHLCQDIVYNTRHVWGPLDKTTIEMSNLLSSLFTSAGRHAEAMAVHEGLLREEVSDENETPAGAEGAETVRHQLDLLRRTHARLGKFDKDDSLYKELYQQVATVFGKEKAFQGTPDIASWNAKDAALAKELAGTFVAPTTWEIADGKTGSHRNFMHKRRSSGMQILLNGGTKVAA